MENKGIKLLIATVIPLMVWMVPAENLGIPTLLITQQRVLAIFVFAMLMWLMEVIPIWVTSVSVIVLLLLTVSDSSLLFLREGYQPDLLGPLVAYEDLLHVFANPILMLFLAGILIAIAAHQVNLDARMSKVMLNAFGDRTESVMLGLMIVTALFSMFMSNTATTALMLAVIAPILRVLPRMGNERAVLLLSVPFASNIGGMATPIGTPPNLVALQVLNDHLGLDVSFGMWMLYMFPLTIFMLFVTWILLVRMLPFKRHSISVDILIEENTKGKKQVRVGITIIMTVLLWIFGESFGLNVYVVSLFPIVIFGIMGVIGREELSKVNWSVLWLFAGSFALGIAQQKTGVFMELLQQLQWDSMSSVMIMVVGAMICYLVSSFLSNSATAGLMIPLVATSMITPEVLLSGRSSVAMIVLAIAAAASLAMALPISTPSNALAYAEGGLRQNDMMKVGSLVGLIGLITAFVVLSYLSTTQMF